MSDINCGDLLPVAVVEAGADEDALPLVEQAGVQVQPALGQLQEEVGEPAAHGQQPAAQSGLEPERDVVALLAGRVHLRVAALLQGHRRYLRTRTRARQRQQSECIYFRG